VTDFLADFLPTCCICPTMLANCPMQLILLDMITVIIYSELYRLLSYLLCNEWMNVQYIQSWSTWWPSKKFQILAASQTEEKVCYYKVFGNNTYVTFNVQISLIIFSTIFIYMWGDTTHIYMYV
jgi:branched-subunit amino acid transport protein AzlD